MSNIEKIADYIRTIQFILRNTPEIPIDLRRFMNINLTFIVDYLNLLPPPKPKDTTNGTP